MNAIQAIFDPETADTCRDCNVNDSEAILYTKDERSFLCWTLSENFSFVLEYTPSAVTEDEIFMMAESLHLPR